MSQFYNKNNRFPENTYNASNIFAGGIETPKCEKTTYLGVLTIFRKMFKNISYNDLF